jgi:DNA gyrase subunit A
MSELTKGVSIVSIEAELKQSYLDYAMSVIVGRALPDVRDGLKPVHRRILYAMQQLGNDWNKAHKKSARIVGEVIGKYHPHGDTAVYDAMVRMAQHFSLRYMLVDGQGNFGSVDGDSAAAMRYTEVRMSRFAHTLLADLDKETVNFLPNYDETEFYPSVLPTRVPNLLVNGTSGIAVGMATNVPPHNLREVIDACIATLHNPEIDLNALMNIIPGPDFPTAGIINGRAGIVQAYQTGRGRISVRARTTIESDEKSGKDSIIVTELPYQVNKARLIEKIAELVKDKRVEGITALRDESDKDGMRVVIELRRGELTEVILNNLFMHTQMQVVFGMNMVALVDGQPRTLSLKRIIEEFLRHRREVVTRRTLYNLRKARERAHLLEGLGIALVNIEEMIALIKASSNPTEAKKQLLDKLWESGDVAALLNHVGAGLSRPEHLGAEYGLQAQGYRLSTEQAQAILDLRLHRLTGLEQEKIHNEYKELLQKIQEYLKILTDPDTLKQVILDELDEISKQFADPRRTEITSAESDLSIADLITPEDVVVTLSYEGYAKTQSLDVYQAQKRGGRGKSATNVKDEDFIETLLIANTHDTLLCFSNEGKVYWLQVYQIPQASRQSRGRPMVNLLPLAENERISSILKIQEYNATHYVFMATSKGTVKKVTLEQFSRPRTAGLRAIELDEDDHLIGVALTDGQRDIMLMSNAGKAIRLSESTVRAMGRTAHGVRGIKLSGDQKVISLMIIEEDTCVLTATRNGFGQRTGIEEYRTIGRGGQGVIAVQTSERNGPVVSACLVKEADEVMLITDQGTLVRTRVAEISKVGRNTQGVRLIRLTKDENLVSAAPIVDLENDNDRSE